MNDKSMLTYGQLVFVKLVSILALVPLWPVDWSLLVPVEPSKNSE